MLTALFGLILLLNAEEPSVPTDCLPEDKHPPTGFVLYVYALDKPALMLPEEMAREAWPVFECESRHETTAEGKQGERGVAQIHPIHRPELGSLGLDFNQEIDRLQFATILWRRSGWSDWACQTVLLEGHNGY